MPPNALRGPLRSKRGRRGARAGDRIGPPGGTLGRASGSVPGVFGSDIRPGGLNTAPPRGSGRIEDACGGITGRSPRFCYDLLGRATRSGASRSSRRCGGARLAKIVYGQIGWEHVLQKCWVEQVGWEHVLRRVLGGLERLGEV